MQRLLDANADEIRESTAITDTSYSLVSEWRFDEQLQIPGPQILKGVVVRAGRYNIMYRRADERLYLNFDDPNKPKFDFELNMEEPIY